MKRIIMAILSIFLPWLVLLINDNPGGAFVAMVLQATVVGWPFASIWAWRVEYPPQKTHKERKNNKETKKS